MSFKIIDTIPMDIEIVYKSHVPTMQIIPMKVNSIYFHKGNELYSLEKCFSNSTNRKPSFDERPSFSIELLDENDKPLPKMICDFRYFNDSVYGYKIKSNMHFTKEDAAKRLCKNLHRILSEEKFGKEPIDKHLLSENIEKLKDTYPHLCI